MSNTLKLLNEKNHIRKDFSDVEFDQIKSLTPHVIDQTRKSIRERVHCILNNINEVPICLYCGSICNFLKSGKYLNNQTIL